MTPTERWGGSFFGLEGNQGHGASASRRVRLVNGASSIAEPSFPECAGAWLRIPMMTRPTKALRGLLALSLALSSASALADPGCTRPSESSACLAFFSAVTPLLSVPVGLASLFLASVIIVRRRASEPGVTVSWPRFLGTTLACFAVPFVVGLLGWEVVSHFSPEGEGVITAVGLCALLCAGFTAVRGGRWSCVP